MCNELNVNSGNLLIQPSWLFLFPFEEVQLIIHPVEEEMELKMKEEEGRESKK